MRIADCSLERQWEGHYVSECERCGARLATVVPLVDAQVWSELHQSVCPRRRQRAMRRLD